jgi:starvation-inducible DNA-binding protein
VQARAGFHADRALRREHSGKGRVDVLGVLGGDNVVRDDQGVAAVAAVITAFVVVVSLTTRRARVPSVEVRRAGTAFAGRANITASPQIARRVLMELSDRVNIVWAAPGGGKETSEPLLHQRGFEVQAFGTLRYLPVGLANDVRLSSCEVLNGILADTVILYSLYKKYHWLVRGHTFFQLHLLFDKHADEQLAIVDLLAERVQTLGGVAIGDPRHVAEVTSIPRPPDGAEEVPAMLSRLLEAHEIVIAQVRDAIEGAAVRADEGTVDLLTSDVLRRHEMQVWFLAEHLVPTPAVRA